MSDEQTTDDFDIEFDNLVDELEFSSMMEKRAILDIDSTKQTILKLLNEGSEEALLDAQAEIEELQDRLGI